MQNAIRMTRSEMIAYIRGNPWIKISHPTFTSDEYIYSKDDGCVYDESGYLFEDWNYAHDGLRIRNDGLFKTDWFICGSLIEHF